MICASVYLLVFIRNLLVHLAEKILLLQPLNFGGDYREPDLLVSWHVSGAVAHLRALDVERPDPGLDAALRPVTMSHNALAAIRQEVFCILCNEGVGLCPQRGSQHAARPIPGNLGQRIIDSFRLTKGDDVCSLLHGVSFLLEVLAGFSTRHDTPPSQTPSPSFPHSSLASFRGPRFGLINCACRRVIGRHSLLHSIRVEMSNQVRCFTLAKDWGNGVLLSIRA